MTINDAKFSVVRLSDRQLETADYWGILWQSVSVDSKATITAYVLTSNNFYTFCSYVIEPNNCNKFANFDTIL